jgi:hypothetical protein
MRKLGEAASLTFKHTYIERQVPFGCGMLYFNNPSCYRINDTIDCT